MALHRGSTKTKLTIVLMWYKCSCYSISFCSTDYFYLIWFNYDWFSSENGVYLKQSKSQDVFTCLININMRRKSVCIYILSWYIILIYNLNYCNNKYKEYRSSSKTLTISRVRNFQIWNFSSEIKLDSGYYRINNPFSWNFIRSLNVTESKMISNGIYPLVLESFYIEFNQIHVFFNK